MKRLLGAVVLTLIFTPPVFGWMCRGKVIKVGDPAERVLRYCGEPSYVSEQEDSTKETWYYSRTNRLGRKLTIRDGEVKNIYVYTD